MIYRAAVTRLFGMVAHFRGQPGVGLTHFNPGPGSIPASGIKASYAGKSLRFPCAPPDGLRANFLNDELQMSPEVPLWSRFVPVPSPVQPCDLVSALVFFLFAGGDPRHET